MSIKRSSELFLGGRTSTGTKVDIVLKNYKCRTIEIMVRTSLNGSLIGNSLLTETIPIYHSPSVSHEKVSVLMLLVALCAAAELRTLLRTLISIVTPNWSVA